MLTEHDRSSPVVLGLSGKELTAFDARVGWATCSRGIARCARSHRDIKVSYELLSAYVGVGIARWQAVFVRVPSGQKVEPEGITQLKLNLDGECTQFLEWWNPKTDVLTAGATTQCNYGARARESSAKPGLGWAFVVIGLLVAVASSREASPSSVAPAALFAYDATRPLELQDRVVDSDVYATVHDISYLGPTGERISAYLVAPKRSGPFAAVLSGHWGNGTRAEFLPEAELYARAGAVSMVHGHRRLLSIFATAARQRVQASTLQQGIIRC